MVEYPKKPRLTHREDLLLIIGELRKFGVTGMELYRSITDIGPVDLDLLNEVLGSRPQTA